MFNSKYQCMPIHVNGKNQTSLHAKQEKHDRKSIAQNEASPSLFKLCQNQIYTTLSSEIMQTTKNSLCLHRCTVSQLLRLNIQHWNFNFQQIPVLYAWCLLSLIFLTCFPYSEKWQHMQIRWCHLLIKMLNEMQSIQCL